ncbi:helix-turn-helix domain-containing protein [Streptomyces longwoodensis]|uniref:AraC family transcriptional regulator n=1 Tax=Streptomyces longwoodensis TaxID=68231 RepID=UPI00386E2063
MTSAVAERAQPLPEQLRSYVTRFAVSATDGTPGEPYTYVPDPAVQLVVRVAAGGRPGALVIGPRTRAAYHASERPASCARFSLAPGAARPLFGVAAADLAGRTVALAELPGRVARRLVDGGRDLAPEEWADHLVRVLPEHPSRAEAERAGLLRAGVAALSVRPGLPPVRVADVARELAVSERQLRNLFTDGVGVSPKHFARIDRVRHVLAHAPTSPWGELAAASGYYDQSHMTADFRALMGVPPRSYFTGRLPSTTPCRAARAARE